MTDFRILLFSTAALFSASAAHAQAAPADDCDRQPNGCVMVADKCVPPDVIVAAGVPQHADQLGQAVTVIDRAEIERRQTVVLSDLLATTPGVTVSRNGGIGAVTAVRIRGAEDSQTLTLIDGVRVNDPSSPGGAFDFASLLAGSIDRVEILRGPNSVPWGSQAIGGVVNIVTAQPTDTPTARFNVDYGAHQTLSANAALSGKAGIVSGALTGGYLRTDGISAAANGTERDGYRQFGGTGRIGVAITDRIGIDLRAYYADSRIDLDGSAPVPPYEAADDPEYSTSKEFYGYAGVHADLLGGRFRNRASFTLANIVRDNFASPAATAPSFFSRGRSERYEYQGDLQVIDPLRLVVGAEHEDSRFFDGTSRPTTGITSVYGEAIVTPIRQLTVTGGVRHDQHRRFGGHTSASVNAALALDEGTTIRASYAEGFKAPTLYQLYSDYGLQTLQPETARNLDLGIAQSLLDQRAQVSVTYFNRHTKNQIDFRSCIGAECVTRPYGLYDNIVRTEARGVEFDMTLRPIDDLTFTANYSYIDSRNRSPGANFGKDLARRPKQTVSVSADYRLPFGLSIGGTVSHVGDSFDNAANTVRLDGYVLAGLRAEMPVGKRVSIYGRVENLFDEKYQTVAGYGTDGRAAYGGIRVKLG
ncbi:MAG: TonB-dependent receptor [Pseudomonadota bacterium]|nr:TonB-dependent receptor [Pseudomonadota bacterium]